MRRSSVEMLTDGLTEAITLLDVVTARFAQSRWSPQKLLHACVGLSELMHPAGCGRNEEVASVTLQHWKFTTAMMYVELFHHPLIDVIFNFSGSLHSRTTSSPLWRFAPFGSQRPTTSTEHGPAKPNITIPGVYSGGLLESEDCGS